MNEHILANLIQELAYLVSGLIICFIGKSLLEKGITGKFSGEGEMASNKVRIVTSSPGIVFLIAGLMIIGLAIWRQSKLPVFPSTPPPSVTRADLEALARTFPSAIYATPNAANDIAEANYLRALDRAGEKAFVATRNHLIRAISLEPSLLMKALREPVLSEAFADAEFMMMMQARLRIAQAASLQKPLPASFKTAITMLKILSLTNRSVARPDEVGKIRAAIPTQDGQEPTDATLAKLSRLQMIDPKALAEVLSTPDFRWFAANTRIQEWVVLINSRQFLNHR